MIERCLELARDLTTDIAEQLRLCAVPKHRVVLERFADKSATLVLALIGEQRRQRRKPRRKGNGDAKGDPA